MKILISADMEGATGVTWPADVLPGTPQWERCRSMFTSDVNAAVLGFFDGGADEVLVNEAHWTMRNLLLEQLDERAEMLTGRHKSLSMVEGVQHGDVDGDRVRRLPHGRRHGGRPRPHLPRQLHHRRVGGRRTGQRGPPQRPCGRRVRGTGGAGHRGRPGLRGRARLRAGGAEGRRQGPCVAVRRRVPHARQDRRRHPGRGARRPRPWPCGTSRSWAGRSPWRWSSTPSISRWRPPSCRGGRDRGAEGGVHRARHV